MRLWLYKARINGKWSNPGKRVASSPSPRCSSYWKGSLQVALDDVRPNQHITVLIHGWLWHKITRECWYTIKETNSKNLKHWEVKNEIKILFISLSNLIPVGDGPADLGCRIHQQHHNRGLRIPGYHTKQSDDEAPLMRELWGKPNTPLLLSLASPLWPGIVATDNV